MLYQKDFYRLILLHLHHFHHIQPHQLNIAIYFQSTLRHIYGIHSYLMLENLQLSNYPQHVKNYQFLRGKLIEQNF